MHGYGAKLYGSGDYQVGHFDNDKFHGYGKEYKYSHDYDQNFVEQEFLPDEIKNSTFYQPGNNPRENQFREVLKKRWKSKYDY